MIARKIKQLFIVSLLLAFNAGCDNMRFDNDPRSNFDALWKIIDENYCFFEYKQIDWDAVYRKYGARVKSDMGNYALFELMSEMLSELKDGHVNLIASHDMSRYWNWSEDYPSNFDADIQKNTSDATTPLQEECSTKSWKTMSVTSIRQLLNDVGDGNMSQILANVDLQGHHHRCAQ